MSYGKWHQGKFTPTNPEKYIGDVSRITYRSSWERVLMVYLDSTVEILKWQSEEQEIPYWNPVLGRMARYILDFAFWANTPEGVKKFMVEVKPKKETIEPKRGKSEPDHTWADRISTWLINKAKWTAAIELAKQDGSQFIILTEDHIMPNHNAIKAYKHPKPKVKTNGNVSRRETVKKAKQRQ